MIAHAGLSIVCAQRLDAGDCADCAARPYSVCAAVPDEDLAELHALAETVELEAGEVLVRQGDSAWAFYNVTSGSVRVSALLEDGRRQITGFHFAGSFIGLGEGDRYGVTIEALEAATVCRFRRSDYRALVATRRDLEAGLLQRAAEDLAAAREQVVMLGRKRALERLAAFLVDLPSRDPMRPSDVDHISLPMTRGDIADYLGLTLETVSRCFTELRKRGLVALAPGEATVLKPRALRDLAVCDDG